MTQGYRFLVFFVCLTLGLSLVSAAYAEPVSLDSKVQVGFSGFVLNRVTKTYDTRLTVVNKSSETIIAPLSVVVTGISSPQVTLANSTGISPQGQPLLAVPIPAAGLAPGATVSNVVLKFNNPANAAFTFTRSIFGVISSSPLPPPVNVPVNSDLFSSSASLYSGTNAAQTGVNPGTIEPRRVAVLRGKVSNRDGAPLSGVKISVLGHPEFGQTLTHADGGFDLAVNGGGPLTLRYEKNGFPPAQRAIVAPWRDYAWLPDVVMIAFDSAVTLISTAAPGMQVARGSPVSDADGPRRATILFPLGTGATMVMPNGSTQPLTTLNVRATEYTVGASGARAMPASLPPNSAYTYAAEFSVDEAVAAGATEVRFSQALPVYVENFLGFPVGTAVPTGYYDRQKGQWIASDNGRVIKVLGIADNLALLDLDGNGIVDDAAANSALGVTTEERARLAQLYVAGQTLWRMSITHFSAWDANWGSRPDCDPDTQSCAPNLPPPPADIPLDDPNQQCGSVIGCENQTLGESVIVSGTPWRLRYSSDRTPARTAAYTIGIPLSGATVPSTLKRIDLTVEVAGNRFTRSFPNATGQRTTFTWNGKDGYGRTVQGSQQAVVRVGYTYGLRYTDVSRFGYNGNGTQISGNRDRAEATIWQERRVRLGVWDARAAGLGGWTLDVQQLYDPNSRTLLLGNGQQRRSEALPSGISTVAGNGGSRNFGDGGPAIAANLNNPSGVAVGPDGSLYIADQSHHRIRRVTPDGIITTVAGNGDGDFSGDGGPATAARLKFPEGVAVGRDGTLYIADPGNHRIRRVAPDGIITTFAGNGSANFSGDGGPATAAAMKQPAGVAVGPDGSVYIADLGNLRVRRVGPDGIITTVAGTGIYPVRPSANGDGGLAANAPIDNPYGVAVGPDGSLYIGFDHCVRRVGPDGIITKFAGTQGWNSFYGDGGPAVDAALDGTYAVAAGPDGSVYIATWFNQRIRHVGPDGIITTLAGGGDPVTAGFYAPRGVAVAPDGSLYVADRNLHRIRRVGAVLPGVSLANTLMPSEDGSELYLFNSSGQQLRTLDALTGAVQYQFGYDGSGYLTSVMDSSGNVTSIVRSGALPTAIVAPGGQRTTLEVDANGWLQSATNPANEAHAMSYSADGLLQTFTDPRGNLHRYSYDSQGRLVKDENPAGGWTALSRTEQSNGYTVTTTSALGRSHSYQVEQLSTGAIRRTVTQPSGARTVTVIGTDGSEQTTYADGSSTSVTYGPDPRWGMQVRVASSVIAKTPSGITRTLTTTRTATLSDINNVLSLKNLTDTIRDNGIVSTRVYDGTSRSYTSTTAAGRSRIVGLDALGRLKQDKVAELEPVTFTYNTRGLVSTMTEGSGAGTRNGSLAYNAALELTNINDPLGRSASFQYDLGGRVIKQTLPDGRLVGYAYDANGNVAYVTPPGRPAHAFTYTSANLEKTYTPPVVPGVGTPATAYQYNADRQLTKIVRPDAQTLEFAYDAAGRRSLLTTPTGSTSYAYTSSDKLATLVAPGGVWLTYGYDGFLPTSEAWSGPVPGSVMRTYDARFRLAGLSVNGTSVAFSYDADGLLTQAGELRIVRNLANGVVTGTVLGSTTTSQSYNAFGELQSLGAKHGSTELYLATYTRDKLGRITRKVETIQGVTEASTYTYDLAGRLTQTTKGLGISTSRYDTNGNRLEANQNVLVYDAQDRLTNYGGTIYTYTANGELKSQKAGASTTLYDYDVLGNLRKVTLPSGALIEYLIDGRNRRIGKKVNGVLVQGLLYQDQLKPIAELDSTGKVITRFVYGTRTNAPEYMTKGGVIYRFIHDHLGSPRLIVNTATGAVVQRMDFDEWGFITLDTNPGFQPFGFAGGLLDQHTKLTRFGARDYDSLVGRWTAKDPIGFESGDVNLYTYVEDNPINLVDTFGFEGESADPLDGEPDPIAEQVPYKKVPFYKQLMPKKLKWIPKFDKWNKVIKRLYDFGEKMCSSNPRDTLRAIKEILHLVPQAVPITPAPVIDETIDQILKNDDVIQRRYRRIEDAANGN